MILLLALQFPQEWIRDRVKELGAEDYAVREKATADLKALRKALDEALAEAEKSRDPEVSARARQLREAPFAAIPIRAHSTQKGGAFTVEYDCVPSKGDFTAKVSPAPARIVIVNKAGRTAEIEPDGSTFTPPKDFGLPVEMRVWTER
jgi:hypothetical protein